MIEACGDRIKVFGDILLQGAFLFGDEVPAWDDKAFVKRVQAPGAARLVADYRAWLAGRPPAAWDSAAELERETQQFLAERGKQLGDLVHAVRVATTGVAAGPGLFDCLSVLGPTVALARIDRALARAHAGTAS